MKKIKIIRQHDVRDCGAACLAMISQYYGNKNSFVKIRDYIETDRLGTNFLGIVCGAEKIGLEATALEGNEEELLQGVRCGEVTLPAIVRVVIEDALEHYIVLEKIEGKKAWIVDPGRGVREKILLSKFFLIWSGHVLTFKVKEKKCEDRKQGQGLKRLVKQNVGGFLQIILLSGIVSIISIVSSYILQYLVDGLEAAQNLNVFPQLLTRICIGVGILYIIQAILAIIRGNIIAKVAGNLDELLLNHTIAKMVHLPMKFFDYFRLEEVVTRISDTGKIKEALCTCIINGFVNITLILGCIVVLGWKSWKILACALLTALLYVGIMMLFKKKITIANYSVMEKNAQMISFIKEGIDGIGVIKTNIFEKKYQERAEVEVKQYVNAEKRTISIKNVQNAVVGVVTALGILSLLWVGSSLVMRGTMTVGSLVMTYTLVGYLFSGFKSLVELQTTVDAALVSSQRLNDIWDMDSEVYLDGEMDFPIKSLELNDVSFRYNNRGIVLSHINLQISRGEKIAIVGESGCGKTTLLKLLLKFYPCTSGEIRLNKNDISKMPADFFRQKMSYVPQDSFFFADTIYQNLVMGTNQVNEEEMKHVLKLVGADEIVNKLPGGLNYYLKENGDDLSGGEKQKLALVRAIIRKPEVLVLDEATSHLDYYSEQKVMEAIFSYLKNTTCIMSAHRLSTVKLCDNIYVMKKGSFVEKGTHSALMRQNSIYRELWMCNMAE